MQEREREREKKRKRVREGETQERARTCARERERERERERAREGQDPTVQTCSRMADIGVSVCASLTSHSLSLLMRLTPAAPQAGGQVLPGTALRIALPCCDVMMSQHRDSMEPGN